MADLKTPPNNVEAERAVLGSILLDTTGRGGDRVMDVCLTSGISEGTFFDPRNRVVYAAMQKMNRESRPLDPITLLEDLRTAGQLEPIGGAAYVQSLIDGVQTTANVEYYIEILRAKQLRRTLIDRASVTIERCYDEATYPDAKAVLGETEKSFLEIGDSGAGTMPWDKAIDLSFRRIDAMFESRGKALEGLSTGLKYLDERLQGLKESEMIVIAARPSVGKTSLAMNIAESCALGRMLSGVPVPYDEGKPHPVLVFSLEMPVEALTKRMIAGRAGVNMWKLNRGQCARAEREELSQRLVQAAGELRAAPIFVDDTAGLDVMDMRARARRMKKAHNIELVVIDYLQLCSCQTATRLNSRQIEVSMISQQIKAMAKELKIPVIVLSQLSRANEQRGDKEEKPKLSDLRDSGAIEQDADVVFLLRRPSRTASSKDAADETLAIVDVAKNRNGETGEVRVEFIREFTRFGDREPEHSADSNYQEEPPPEQRQLTSDPMF